jgi:mannose-1-phosphate guanylyltransferase/mannose-6-phosphate isomerase
MSPKTMPIVDNVMILAGGSGTRLWPASTRELPKQFMRVRDGKSLIGLTIERAAALNPRRILIITLASQSAEATAELEAFAARTEGPCPELLILPEPVARNTAPAIAAGAACLTLLGAGSETALVLPADHLIEPLSGFKSEAAEAAVLAKEGYIVTFGIVPTRPETGYGYIEAGASIAGHSSGHLVARFREKPDLKTAESFLQAGNCTWNSGMFLFTLSIFASELEEHAPQTALLYRALSALGVKPTGETVKTVFDDQAVSMVYEKTPKVSVDYALMEKTRRAAVLSASFAWNDVGGWDEYSALFTGEAPARAEVESTGNYILSDLPVALVGVEDLIVVVKNGRVLVSRKGAGQGVKEALDALPEEYR